MAKTTKTKVEENKKEEEKKTSPKTSTAKKSSTKTAEKKAAEKTTAEKPSVEKTTVSPAKNSTRKKVPVERKEEKPETAEQLPIPVLKDEVKPIREEEKSDMDKTTESQFMVSDEKNVTPIVEIIRAIRSKMKPDKDKKRYKRRKFNPLPSMHAERYNPDYKVGLNEEQLEERYENDLINRVENKYSKSYRSIFFSNIFTFFNLLGLICCIALIVSHAPINRFLFCIVYIFNISAGIIQEIKAKHSIEKLSLLSSKSAKVVRNGSETEISTSEIVLDDILHFSLGNQISTDSIIVEGSVEVNESLLTGESVAVKKNVGDFLYAGSFITSGNCYARAEKVGKENYVEILSAKAKKYRKPHSELMHSISLIITFVGCLIVPIAIGMFIKIVSNNESVLSAIDGTVAVIIGMIPAGMVLLTSMALAVGAIRLAKNNTLIQDLYSLEMLARIDVLCLDKTGTITDGRMRVSDCIIVNNNIPNTISEVMGSMLSALNDNNQTSIALNNHFGRNTDLKPLKVLPFNSTRKLSAVTFEEYGTYAFGAPEFVLKEVPDNVSRMIKQYASMGLRVLLLCYSKSSITGEKLPSSMKAVALITISDNIREDAVSTINWFKENGVAIKIISGDNPITVSEVARRVGVENANQYISLEGLSESDVINVANKYTVFGRVTPEQKAILVRAIKSAGHNCAMTGDGVNDILALKEANCAISVGSGSDAARNVSHIVLTDSNFSSMPKVVYEGRRVINNIQDTASLYLMKTLFITMLSLIVLLIPGALYPFNTANMMLIEMLIIGLASAFLSFQVNTKRVEGKFVNYVIRKSFPGALLMLLSVLFVILIKPFSQDTYGYSNEFYQTLMTHAMNFAGVIMLYHICKPFNLFRGVMYAGVLLVLLVITVWSMISGAGIFELVAITPFVDTWHHILIVLTIVMIDIPLINYLEMIIQQLRPSNKKKFK